MLHICRCTWFEWYEGRLWIIGNRLGGDLSREGLDYGGRAGGHYLTTISIHKTDEPQEGERGREGENQVHRADGGGGGRDVLMARMFKGTVIVVTGSKQSTGRCSDLSNENNRKSGDRAPSFCFPL